MTIVDRFRTQVATQPDRPALRYFESGAWQNMSWGEYGTAVEETAAGLIDLGIRSGDCVGLLADNQPGWHIADLAVLSVGAVTVPVYPTSSSSQVAYVLRDSSAKLCFVDSAAQLAKVLLRRDELPELEWVAGIARLAGLDRTSFLTDAEELRTRGRAALIDERGLVRDRPIARAAPATLVYTSGTTGPPKGTILTHANIEWTTTAVQSVFHVGGDDRFLSYLPLSHIAERITSHFGQVESGGVTWFARSLATMPEDLGSCRPTVFVAVPRVWQKMRDVVLEEIAGRPRPIRSAFDRYLLLGHQVVEARAGGPRPALGPRMMYLLLDRVIGARIRRRLGLDRTWLAISSAAPIHPDLLRWFHAIGIEVGEVWGQTEDCGPATMNRPGAIRIGTVGTPLPGLEIRGADDGELLVRGGSVCLGYHERPDATAELIDEEGWMHTGDLGAVDADGYVTITGRKRDLIINAAGKNISPSEIESRLVLEPLIGQAVVVGDGRRYLVALLTLDADEVAEWAERHGTFADIGVLVDDPAVRAEIASGVERVNQRHAPVEQIKYWRLLPDALTVAGGELTPTLKVKRHVVTERHADLLEEMYAEGLSPEAVGSSRD